MEYGDSSCGMSAADEGGYSLSKGTQSEGLTSDTSSDEWRSGSSSENSLRKTITEKVTIEKNDDRSGKVTMKDSIGEMLSDRLADDRPGLSIAKTSKGDGDKLSKGSKQSVRLQKSWLDWEETRTKCPRYFRWGVLLSFGFGLWVALCIADAFQSMAFIKKEGWIVEMATAKKVTLKAETIKKPAPHVWWFFNLWGYAWSSIISINAIEAFMFLSSLTVMIYAESHVRKRWRGPTNKCDQYCKSILQARTDLGESESSNLRFNMFDEETLPITSDNNCSETRSKFGLDGHRSMSSQESAESMSKLTRKDNLWSRLVPTTSDTGNNTRKSSNNSTTASMNEGQWCWRENNSTSGIKCPFKDDVLSDDAFRNELSSDKGKPDKTHASYVPKEEQMGLDLDGNDRAWSEKDDAAKITPSENLDCRPDLDRADQVMRTFDLEIEEYLKVENNASTIAFREIGRDMKRLRTIDCECDEQVKKFILDSVDMNTGIVSSSPAFQKFLLNLRKDQLSCPYL